MSSNRQRHRQQVGTTLTNEPQNSPGVAQFSVSEVAQFSMSLDRCCRLGRGIDWSGRDRGENGHDSER
jgi:hypothetical protein